MLIDVGGRSYAVFSGEFARRSLNWSVVPSFQAFYCSPGARAECLQIVFVVIGVRLRGTIQRSSSLTSSSSRVVYERDSRRAVSSGSSEELRHLKSNSVVRNL